MISPTAFRLRFLLMRSNERRVGIVSVEDLMGSVLFGLFVCVKCVGGKGRTIDISESINVLWVFSFSV